MELLTTKQALSFFGLYDGSIGKTGKPKRAQSELITKLVKKGLIMPVPVLRGKDVYVKEHLERLAERAMKEQVPVFELK